MTLEPPVPNHPLLAGFYRKFIPAGFKVSSFQSRVDIKLLSSWWITFHRVPTPFLSLSAAFRLPAYVGRMSFPNSSITASSSPYFPAECWPLGLVWSEAAAAAVIEKRVRRFYPNAHLIVGKSGKDLGEYLVPEALCPCQLGSCQLLV